MKSKDLTVVVVNDFDYIQGGASKVAIDTAQILKDNGNNVIFFSAVHEKNLYDFKLVTTNQKECLNDGLFGALRCIYNIKAAREFKKMLKTLDNSRTIIHVHGWTKALSSSIFRVAQKEKFKVVLTLHDYFTACPNGGFFNYKKCKICQKNAMSLKCLMSNCDSRNFLFKIYRCLRQLVQNYNMRNIKKSGYLISISDFSLDKLQKYLSNNVVIKNIPNPIGIKKQKRVIAEKNNKYVYVGRVSKEKGVNVFCQAIDKLNLNGVVVGDGSELVSLKQQFPKIDFVGWKNSDEVLEYMKQARCLIFPSLWYETAGLTAIESSFLGVPVITSNMTASTDYITNNFDGLYFNTGDVNDLVEKIKLMQNDKLVKKISENAYMKNNDNPYSYEKYYKSLYKYYINILRKH